VYLFSVVAVRLYLKDVLLLCNGTLTVALQFISFYGKKLAFSIIYFPRSSFCVVSDQLRDQVLRAVFMKIRMFWE